MLDEQPLFKKQQSNHRLAASGCSGSATLSHQYQWGLPSQERHGSKHAHRSPEKMDWPSRLPDFIIERPLDAQKIALADEPRSIMGCW